MAENKLFPSNVNSEDELTKYVNSLPLPVDKPSLGQALATTWPVRMAKDAWSAVTLPGDVYAGKVDLQSPEAIERATNLAGSLIGSQFPAVAARGLAKDTLGIVPVAAAKATPVKQAIPNDILKQAAANTPGARIDPDGSLVMTVSRGQQAAQDGAESVRGGVFYLPTGDKNARHYMGKNNYGGPEKFEGETAFKNPLVVKGATGGRAPEAAYNQIMGDKKAFDSLEKDVMNAVNTRWANKQGAGVTQRDFVEQFLEKHAPEMIDYAQYILDNSQKGNQLRYALQEAAIASAARKAGYDGILGYSVKRDKSPVFSEVYDVRESHYPYSDGTKRGGYEMHPQYNLTPVDHDPFK